MYIKVTLINNIRWHKLRKQVIPFQNMTFGEKEVILKIIIFEDIIQKRLKVMKVLELFQH